MNELQIFENSEFGKVRTLNENGTILFCGTDVAQALGYVKPRDAVNVHCPHAVKRGIGVQTGKKADGKPAIQTVEMSFIPESDLYRLVFKSKLPTAEKFTDWVTEEVLPSIRKTGSYSIQSGNPYANMVPKSFSEALFLAAKLAQENEALKEENEVQRQVIADYQPKVDYYTTILQSTDTMTVTQIAADYGLTAHKLNKILHDEGVQRKAGEQWVLYRNYMGNGYTKSETVPIQYSNGNMGSRLFTKWSQKGRLMIHEILTKRGIKAIMDLENEE